MTDAEKLTALKIELGIDGTDDDLVLNRYITKVNALYYKMVFPFDNKLADYVDPDYVGEVMIEIVKELFAKRGGEGQKSHNELGVNRSYEAAYISDSLRKLLVMPYGYVPSGGSG